MEKVNYLDSDSISKFLKCPYCKDIFIHPMIITSCMHTYCSICINNIIKDKGKCLLCLSQLDEKTKLIKHNLVENCLNELFVFCPNEKKGCLWIENRDKLETHIKICIFNNNDIFTSRDETEKDSLTN